MSLLTDLQAYWKLGEASGTRSDSHGANHLTDSNSVGQAVGKLGNGAEFTAASSQSLFRADTAALSAGASSFTIAGWFKFVDIGTETKPLVSKWVSASLADSEYILQANTSNKLEFFVTDGSSSGFLEGTDVLSDGVWYYIVAWHDADNDTINIQVNNGTPDSTSWGNGSLDTTSDFKLGVNDTFFSGVMDSIGFWKRVLTTQERTELYNSGNGLEYPFVTEVAKLSGKAGMVMEISYDFSVDSLLGMRSGLLADITRTGLTPISGVFSGKAGTSLKASYEHTGRSTLRGTMHVRPRLSYEHTLADRFRGSAGVKALGALGTATGIPLFITGIFSFNNSLPLFISGPVTTPLSDSISLTMFANTAGTSGVFGGIPLWMDGTNNITNSINLFLQGPEFNSLSRELTLYIAGAYYNISGSLPLFLQNTGISSHIPLFIQGTGPSGIGGETAGALPLMSSLNLYLERPASNWIPLTIFGPGVSASGDIPLYMHGVFPLSDNIPLVIPNVIGVMRNSITLYTHGF